MSEDVQRRTRLLRDIVHPRNLAAAQSMPVFEGHIPVCTTVVATLVTPRRLGNGGQTHSPPQTATDSCEAEQ